MSDQTPEPTEGDEQRTTQTEPSTPASWLAPPTSPMTNQTGTSTAKPFSSSGASGRGLPQLRQDLSAEDFDPVVLPLPDVV